MPIIWPLGASALDFSLFHPWVKRGEEGQPHQSLVQTTFSSFSRRPNHLGILVLRLFCVKKFPILEDKTIF